MNINIVIYILDESVKSARGSLSGAGLLLIFYAFTKLRFFNFVSTGDRSFGVAFVGLCHIEKIIK